MKACLTVLSVVGPRCIYSLPASLEHSRPSANLLAWERIHPTQPPLCFRILFLYAVAYFQRKRRPIFAILGP